MLQQHHSDVLQLKRRLRNVVETTGDKAGHYLATNHKVSQRHQFDVADLFCLGVFKSLGCIVHISWPFFKLKNHDDHCM